MSEPQTDDNSATQWHHGPITSRLFALIIGINTYDDSKYFFNLRGARADALRLKAYLEESLLVPETHIKLLLDKQASRQKILETLEELANDKRIVRDDPLLIFFAGHGTEIEDVVDGEKSKIQMIVPADYIAIPDFIIGRLLDYIADNKGNNITVIFDCCNSASGTRGSIVTSNPSAPLTRAIDPSHVKYKKDLDQVLLRRIRRATQDGLRKLGVQSHMLLAACQSSEEAREKNGFGVFSSALLNLFKAKPPTILRYCDILDQMDVILGQNPQCQGPFQDRMLFDGKCKTRSIKSKFKVQTGPFRDPMSNMTIHAGSAHGVTNGAVFEVYDSVDASFTRPLARATVQPVIRAFCSPAILDPGHSLHKYDSKTLVAIQVRSGEKEALRLYVPPGDPFRKIYSDAI
ncbi:hypothetical protein JR316_0009962 [Psilocybe cubensis]|nr:hypothetical protein JR316_0009962 [Psilocybe cubensis]KAH9477735.1 hypothetical protein JR316_0009962 [Psilocybe cubensis]